MPYCNTLVQQLLFGSESVGYQRAARRISYAYADVTRA